MSDNRLKIKGNHYGSISGSHTFISESFLLAFSQILVNFRPCPVCKRTWQRLGIRCLNPPAVKQSVGHHRRNDLCLAQSAALNNVMYLHTIGRWGWWREAQVLPAQKYYGWRGKKVAIGCKPVFLCWWLLLSVLRFCVLPFDQSSQHSPSLFHCNTVHDIIIAVSIPLWSPERLQQSLMYQALGLISIHSALGITKELSFLLLRSFPFRIKFWIAWCLSRGSNEEMMLQNAVLPRCAFSSAPSLSPCFLKNLMSF